MTSQDRQTLIDAYLDGELDEAGVTKLTEILRVDASARRAFVLASQLQSYLESEVRGREIRRVLGYPSSRHPTIGGRRPLLLRALPVIAALAAMLLVAAGLLVVRGALADHPATVATLVDLSGLVEIRRGTAAITGLNGLALNADDQVTVAGSGHASIAWPDGTRFELGSGTVLGLVGGLGSKRLYLPGGNLRAQVSPQPEGQPLIIATPHAEATVVGTEFQLLVSDGRTSLSVEHGMVELLDRDTSERYRVSTGKRHDVGPAVTRRLPTVTPPEQPDARLGIELAGCGETGPELPFVDVFRTAGPWRAGGAGGALTLDAKGWVAHLEPGQIAETVMCRNMGGRYPLGLWTCLYEGTGVIEASGDAVVTAVAPGQLTLSVEPGPAGIVLRLVDTDPGDPVRNIRVLMPGFEANSAADFHPAFLARWRGTAVIHAGGWSEGRGGSTSYRWDDRLVPGQGPLPSERGRPLEDAIDLAAALGCDLWLRLPHQADDSFVTGAARLVQERLPRNQRVYVEIGRDLWDGAWEPGQYARAHGVERGYETRRAGIRWYIDRSLEVFAAWQTAVGRDPRLVRVLSLNDNPAFLNEAFTWHEAPQHIDAIAVLSGLGTSIGNDQAVDAIFKTDVTEAVDAFRLPLAKLPDRLAGLKAQTESHGLRLIGVRSAAHIWVGNQTIGTPNWRHFVHVNQFSDLPEVRSILSEWWALWLRGTGDLILASPPMDQLRNHEGAPGMLGEAEELAAYQAIAPYLRRQAPR